MAERRKDGPYWVKAWIADLSQLTDQFRDDEGKVDFEALGREEYQFRMALARKDFSLSERAKKVWDEAIGPYNQRIGAARKGNDSVPVLQNSRKTRTVDSANASGCCPKSREEFKAFVALNDLHIALAEEWYEMSEKRGWTFENGEPIRDWKAAVANYCKKKEQKRRTA